MFSSDVWCAFWFLCHCLPFCCLVLNVPTHNKAYMMASWGFQKFLALQIDSHVCMILSHTVWRMLCQKSSNHYFSWHVRLGWSKGEIMYVLHIYQLLIHWRRMALYTRVLVLIINRLIDWLIIGVHLRGSGVCVNWMFILGDLARQPSACLYAISTDLLRTTALYCRVYTLVLVWPGVC